MIHRKRKNMKKNGLHGIMCSKLIVLLITNDWTAYLVITHRYHEYTNNPMSQ